MAAPKKKNGFYFFMKEVQEIENQKGRTITLKTLPQFCHPTWKKMSAAEREPYEELAREYNKNRNLCGVKLACDGTRVEDNLLDDQDKIILENKMKQDVKTYCSSDYLTQEQFTKLTPKKLFYFMSFNILCVTDEDMFIPLEVGIVEYNIQYGIRREYNKIIYPGLPPTGYTRTAKDKSEQTHEINIFGEKGAENNIRILYEEIVSFICPSGNEEYPPIFCDRKHLLITKGCLEWICKTARKENVFKVYDAAFLLLELAAGIGKALPSYTIASDLLNKTSFDYHPSTRCKFHEEKDNHYCALSYSKKICYLLSDAVCKTFNVELTENHIPARAVEEKLYSVIFPKDPKQRSNDQSTLRLDEGNNYYQNPEKEETKYPKFFAQRQPSSISLVEEMKRLNLPRCFGRGVRRE